VAYIGLGPAMETMMVVALEGETQGANLEMQSDA
jgi:hypothetical protein